MDNALREFIIYWKLSTLKVPNALNRKSVFCRMYRLKKNTTASEETAACICIRNIGISHTNYTAFSYLPSRETEILHPLNYFALGFNYCRCVLFASL
jgi:hypothetical protein